MYDLVHIYIFVLCINYSEITFICINYLRISHLFLTISIYIFDLIYYVHIHVSLYQVYNNNYVLQCIKFNHRGHRACKQN